MDDTINDMSRNDAAERDQARNTLSVDETSVIFADAGVPRSVRTVQRYCKNGHLDCIGPVATSARPKAASRWRCRIYWRCCKPPTSPGLANKFAQLCGTVRGGSSRSG